MKPSRKFSIFATFGFIALIIGMFLFINSNAKEDSGFNSTQMLLISAGLIFVVSTALYIGAMFTDQYYRNHDP